MLALVHDVLRVQAADERQRLVVVTRETVVEVVEAANTPARWHLQLLRLGCLLAFEDRLQAQPIVLVLLLDGIDVKGAQGRCG